tara:strand:- start:364 stop:501 length:138 start_codon:yes stop_codon:yes gene_type:complete
MVRGLAKEESEQTNSASDTSKTVTPRPLVNARGLILYALTQKTDA